MKSLQKKLLPSSHQTISVFSFFTKSFSKSRQSWNTPTIALLFFFISWLALFSLYTLTNKKIILLTFLSILVLYLFFLLIKAIDQATSPGSIFVLFTQYILEALGSIGGTVSLIFTNSIVRATSFISQNKIISSIILLYLFITLSQLTWGLPSNVHPFSYHMDEWAQAHSLMTTFKNGSPQIWGGTNGLFFYYVVTGIFLIPFVLVHFVNPLVIKSSLLMMNEQLKLFAVLRISTITFAVLSILSLYLITKDYLHSQKLVAVLFFTLTPLTFLMTVFYRYDTALAFWILISLLFAFRYAQNPTTKNFIILGIVSALALSTKLSALPVIPAYVIAFILFTPFWQKKLRTLSIAIILMLLVFLITAAPDFLISYKAISFWFYKSAITGPAADTNNFTLGMPYGIFFIFFEYPSLFGHVYYFLFLVSFFFLLGNVWNTFLHHKITLYDKKVCYLLATFVLFALSIIQLGIGARGNRMLVFLPFFGLIPSVAYSYLMQKTQTLRKYLIIIFISLTIVQFLESMTWVTVKLSASPQSSASAWITHHIPSGAKIGLENIPIFQGTPDFLLKDFYQTVYFPTQKAKYSYTIISSKDTTFPAYVIISDHLPSLMYMKNSDKKIIVKKLQHLGYQQIALFTPNEHFFSYFNRDINYYMSGLVPGPMTIAVFYRHKTQ